MATYIYEGKSLDGNKIKGELEANSRTEVITALRKEGIYPKKVNLKDEGSKELSFNFFKKKTKARDLIIFCRQFAATLDAGISIIESLDILRKQSEDKRLRETLDIVFNDVQKGIALSTSMKQHTHVFPDMLINMIAAGEYSGALSDILHRMTEHFEKEDRISAKIKSATIYPKILGVVAILVITILLVFVMPNFAKMFDDMGAELPFITQIFTDLGSFIGDVWYIPVLLIISATLIFRYLTNSKEGRIRYDHWKLGIPIFGDLSKKVITSRFSRTLGAMLKSGIPIIEAIEQVIQVIGNKYVEERLLEAMEHIKRGEGVSRPLAAIESFPPMLISMIRIGEETGTLDDLLVKTSEFYDEEVERASTAMITALNPLIIVVMAIVLAPVLIAIALPMFDMYTHML